MSKVNQRSLPVDSCKQAEINRVFQFRGADRLPISRICDELLGYTPRYYGYRGKIRPRPGVPAETIFTPVPPGIAIPLAHPLPVAGEGSSPNSHQDDSDSDSVERLLREGFPEDQAESSAQAGTSIRDWPEDPILVQTVQGGRPATMANFDLVGRYKEALAANKKALRPKGGAAAADAATTAAVKAATTVVPPKRGLPLPP